MEVLSDARFLEEDSCAQDLPYALTSADVGDDEDTTNDNSFLLCANANVLSSDGLTYKPSNKNHKISEHKSMQNICLIQDYKSSCYNILEHTNQGHHHKHTVYKPKH